MSNIVDQLLDAAFRELQHDTGPSDMEWQHSRSVLIGKFRAILNGKQEAELALLRKERDDYAAAWEEIFDARRVNGMTHREAAKALIAQREAATARADKAEARALEAEAVAQGLRDALSKLQKRITDADWCDAYADEMEMITQALAQPTGAALRAHDLAVAERARETVSGYFRSAVLAGEMNDSDAEYSIGIAEDAIRASLSEPKS